MPSETPAAAGRCYCGASAFKAGLPPQTVAYCHCSDCRRWTGGPVGAFAAFAADALTFQPPLGPGFSAVPGVTRWSCPNCGSPLAARFDYLPGQVYVPVGLLDDAGAFPPELHCHSGSQLSWLHLSDDLPRERESGRATLRNSGGQP